MIYLLECPRCLRTKDWDSEGEEPPGECFCKSYQNWRVLKAPRPKLPGFVIVYSDKGSQELRKENNWQVDPKAWKK